MHQMHGGLNTERSQQGQYCGHLRKVSGEKESESRVLTLPSDVYTVIHVAGVRREVETVGPGSMKDPLLMLWS